MCGFRFVECRGELFRGLRIYTCMSIYMYVLTIEPIAVMWFGVLCWCCHDLQEKDLCKKMWEEDLYADRQGAKTDEDSNSTSNRQ